MKQNIVIVNYGMGNVGSIRNMLKYIGYDALISGKPEDIKNADKLILSGVGAFEEHKRRGMLGGTGGQSHPGENAYFGNLPGDAVILSIQRRRLMPGFGMD
jgi:hypothetical protein